MAPQRVLLPGPSVRVQQERPPPKHCGDGQLMYLVVDWIQVVVTYLHIQLSSQILSG